MYNTIKVNKIYYILDLSYIQFFFFCIFDIKFSNKVVEQNNSIIYRA